VQAQCNRGGNRESEISFRDYLNGSYNKAITFSYMGQGNENPIGVRMQIYNEVLLKEEGIFLLLDPGSFCLTIKLAAWQVTEPVHQEQPSQQKVYFNDYNSHRK
jgi:hypothetical protein